MINLTKTICASILMMSASDAKLTVYGPQSLKNLFEDQNNEIKTTLANFGHIPYGQSMVSAIQINKDDLIKLTIFRWDDFITMPQIPTDATHQTGSQMIFQEIQMVS